MLKTLIVQNFVLIEELHIDFEQGFTSITGETGAGKSILLGALALLMGQRSDSSVIRPSADKCVIEAVFVKQDKHIQSLLEDEDIDYDEEQLIIRREITAKGKSRAFVNDSPAPLSLLKALSEYLIDIHSQHKNLLLGDAKFQLSVLDLYSQNSQERSAYTEAYKNYLSLQKALAEAKRIASETLKEQDYWQFQFNQLDEANLQEDELSTLEEEEAQLSHAMDIKRGLSYAFSALDDDERGVLQGLSACLDSLQDIESYWSGASELLERVQSTRYELRDIADTLSQAEEEIEHNPQRLNYVSQRLDLLNGLLSRYRVEDVKALIELRDELSQRLEAISNSDQHITELEQELSLCEKQVRERAERLCQTRQKAAKEIEKTLIKGLKELGMPYVRFSIAIEHSDRYTTDGADVVTYLFSANKEIEPEPVAEIASGGEISRLMLCIKALIADRRHLPTIIFDEIDTGVSGDIADRIGYILQDMGQSMQVMAVTHLPQIAAAGSQHIYIYKEHSASTTLSHIRYIEGKERVEEIARMQSGSKLSAVTLAAAQELLDNVQNRTKQ